MDFTLLNQLGVAIVLSSLIGLEREQKYQKYGQDSFGGIRTFALIGLMGALAYMLSSFSIVFFAVLTSGFFALLVVSYVAAARRHNSLGATSDIAAVLVYIVGMLSAMEQYVLATVIALIILSVLHFKGPLHKWAKHLKNVELVSTIEFIVIAFVVLPLLPNESYGPYGFFNPYIVWLMVVFISGISYVSYVAIKFLGAKRGIGLTGFLAGFISSTALTLSFSGESNRNKGIVDPYVLAVIVACSAMFFRILLEVFVLNPNLLKTLAFPMVTMGGIGILSIFYFWFKKDNISKKVGGAGLKLQSPFSMWPAVKFGAFFAFILFLVEVGNRFMGSEGIYLTSLISGVVDVDAITVSMANLAKNGVSDDIATRAIVIAAITNTVVKGGIFLFFGNRKVALKIVFVFCLMLIGGAMSLFFV